MEPVDLNTLYENMYYTLLFTEEGFENLDGATLSIDPYDKHRLNIFNGREKVGVLDLDEEV